MEFCRSEKVGTLQRYRHADTKFEIAVLSIPMS